MSPHLVAELRTWERVDRYLAPIGDKTSREPRGRDIWRFWERAGIDEMYWRGRPHHAFRKALITCLKAQGMDPEAIEFYVGHDLEIRGTYTIPGRSISRPSRWPSRRSERRPRTRVTCARRSALNSPLWPWRGQQDRRPGNHKLKR
jgi:hypothetical protein